MILFDIHNNDSPERSFRGYYRRNRLLDLYTKVFFYCFHFDVALSSELVVLFS